MRDKSGWIHMVRKAERNWEKEIKGNHSKIYYERNNLLLIKQKRKINSNII